MKLHGICAKLKWIRLNNSADTPMAIHGCLYCFNKFSNKIPLKRNSSAIGFNVPNVRIPNKLSVRTSISFLNMFGKRTKVPRYTKQVKISTAIIGQYSMIFIGHFLRRDFILYFL